MFGDAVSPGSTSRHLLLILADNRQRHDGVKLVLIPFPARLLAYPRKEKPYLLPTSKGACCADELIGRNPMAQREHVVKVIDGNTFKTEAHTVRLEGVDAPTLPQSEGLEAKRWLEWLLETGEIVTIEEKATDAEGRIIAQVWINSTDVNGTMREFLSR